MPRLFVFANKGKKDISYEKII
ncbi:Protein of unknown function [Bacillus mycoides]|uniref:Uncharacterized protein n=1 Tax=Bacillus mycoides TaxID=1405 RepID=A0A1G4EI32_BACMY|nr:Protein of unknown function [Bacillus mycoides]